MSERWVGPVLTHGAATRAVIAAIQALNADARVVERGAYMRVLCLGRCRLTADAVAAELGQAFALPRDLEPLMPAFKGALRIDGGEAIWS